MSFGCIANFFKLFNERAQVAHMHESQIIRQINLNASIPFCMPPQTGFLIGKLQPMRLCLFWHGFDHFPHIIPAECGMQRK